MNEFSRVDDDIYVISQHCKLVFHSSITWVDDYGKSRSNHNEYRISNRSESSVVVKRKLSYFLTIDYTDKTKGLSSSLMIYPDHMFELLDKMNLIRNTWLNPMNNGNTFGIVGDKLVVLNQTEHISLHCPADKVLRFVPTIRRDPGGDTIAVMMYIVNVDCSVLLTPRKFSGLLYVLSTLDMTTYANLSLTMATLRDKPYNRTDFTSEEAQMPKPSSTGKTGRDFQFRQKII